MQGVSSALIARNESWVRMQASLMMRRLPSNVEKADLIQAGLIGVAQAALRFKWEGDADSEEAREAFLRYARLRVKGAMLDELRQMDQLDRSERRKIKVIQIARERWRSKHGSEAGLAQLSMVCGIPVSEIARLEQAAEMVQAERGGDDEEGFERGPPPPATTRDEVEARVDTAMVLQRLHKLFEQLPERDRQVIDAYLGVGISPSQLAKNMKVSPSRVTQIYKSVVGRLASQMGQDAKRATDRAAQAPAASIHELVARREAELAAADAAPAWGELIEKTLTTPEEFFAAFDAEGKLVVDEDTRWG